jgi:hypothetical protein
MPLLPITSEQTVAACRALPVTHHDIFICSYPKSGTTWTQNLVCRLLAATIGMTLPDDWHLSHSAPFYEVDQYWEHSSSGDVLSPIRRLAPKIPLQQKDGGNCYRVFNTHLRPHQLPPNAKCIYVVRDPLDVLASFYYHLANMADADGGYTGTPQEFCADFLAGTVLYGKWQDHIQAWLGKGDKSTNSKVLILHYQDMKDNLQEEATKLAHFLGVEDVNLAVETAVPHCTFSAMRKERWRYTPMSVQWKEDETTGKPYDDFVRAGRIGDGDDFFNAYFSEDLKNQWVRDLSKARNWWLQAGVVPEVIKRYLGE